MKIKKIQDYPLIGSLNQYKSMLLGYNNIAEEDIKHILPDLSQTLYSISNYLIDMEPIENGKEFVEFIKNNKNKKMFIIGDYDCDGILATVILSKALSLSGVEVSFIAPDRFIDGYGMKISHIDQAKFNNAEIVLTVDNGITAFDAIKYAKSKELKVIVTDHHTPQGYNPADIVIDPLYNNELFKGISGATVAMKLAYLLYKEFNFDYSFMKDFVSLAAITCLSDVMPLINENRILIKAGLSHLNQQVYIQDSFIFRLAVMLSFYNPKLDSDPYLLLDDTFRHFNKPNIDFYFVPIINAINRVIGDVNEIIYDIMLLWEQPYDGDPTFYINNNRKRMYMKKDLLREHKKDPTKLAVVEALKVSKFDDNYAGIVGLVAAGITESENKPALIGIETDEDIVKMSGRSVSGFNLYQALTEIKNEHSELTFTFGGHAEALGAAIKKNELLLVEQYLGEKFSLVDKKETEQILFELDNPTEVVQLYYGMKPFGNRFEFPKFYLESTIIFCDTKEREFTVKALGSSYPIKYFDKDTGSKIFEIATKNRTETMKMILSVIEDEIGVVKFKLDKLL